jgi:hypothetical protein
MVSNRIITPFSTTDIRASSNPSALVETNRKMRGSRVSVEHVIHLIKQFFPLVTLVPSLRLFQVDVYGIFKAAAILVNILNSFRPNQIAQYFGVQPPTVDELFAGL